MRKIVVIAVVVVVALVATSPPVAPLGADPDWSGWRGPSRDGIASDSPPLIDAFPEKGPVKVWTSEDIPGGDAGGYGSVAVAGGKAFVFVNFRYDEPFAPRTLSKGALDGMGWASGMPEELKAAMEAARVSPERLALKKGDEINKWVDAWLKANVKPEDRKFQGAVQARLRAGDQALPLEVLAKLDTIKDKEFPDQAALDQWYADNGIDADAQKKINAAIPKSAHKAKDAIVCLDAADGRTLWKKEWPANWMWYPASSTPCVADGRVYVVDSSAVAVALDVNDGKEAWRSEPLGATQHSHNRSSSPLVLDGMVIAESDTRTVALDAKDGKIVWSNGKNKWKEGSAVVWKSPGGKTFLLTNFLVKGEDMEIACLDPKTGQAVWSVPAGKTICTPAVAGDVMATCGETDEFGVAGYRLAEDKAEKLWGMPLKDRYTSPVIVGGYVYALGGGNETFGTKDKGRAVCVEAATGKVMWTETVPPAQLASPIVADGKIFATVLGSLYMIQATPEKYTLLGKADLGLAKFASPAFADGKLFLRTNKNVICVDVKK
jgi:outer membrane protein assembly factor BamB